MLIQSTGDQKRKLGQRRRDSRNEVGFFPEFCRLGKRIVQLPDFHQGYSVVVLEPLQVNQHAGAAALHKLSILEHYSVVLVVGKGELGIDIQRKQTQVLPDNLIPIGENAADEGVIQIARLNKSLQPLARLDSPGLGFPVLFQKHKGFLQINIGQAGTEGLVFDLTYRHLLATAYGEHGQFSFGNFPYRIVRITNQRLNQPAKTLLGGIVVAAGTRDIAHT